MKDIYASLKKKNIKKVREVVEIPTQIPIVVKVSLPEVQKVEVTNKPEPKVYPDTQNVKITNTDVIAEKIAEKIEIPKPVTPEKIEIPDTVKISNIEEIAKRLAKEIVFPNKMEVTNQPTLDIPIGKANIPGEADPERYVPVRLTNGKKFYEALQEAFVSGGRQSFPFVDTTGKPKQVQLDSNGNLPVSATITPAADQQVHITPGVTTAVSGSLSLTTTSGSPMNTAITNFPTVQTVNVQNMPQINVDLKVDDVTLAVSGTITTISGSKTDIQNFPTVQTVAINNAPNVQITPGITTAVSGTVTTVSGFHTTIDNFPTFQSVKTELPYAAALADTTVNPTVPGVGSYGMIWDWVNAKWNRIMSANAAHNTTASGLMGVGLLGGGGGSNWFNINAHNTTNDGIQPGTGLAVGADGFIYNGSNWDRMRTANSARGTSGTGLLGVGIMTYDGANWNSPSIYFPGDSDSNDFALETMDRLQAWGGSSWARVRTPNVFKTVTISGSGDATVWTPTSGKKFRLMAYAIEMTNNAAAAAGAVLHVTLGDNSVINPVGQGYSQFVPSAAATTFAPTGHTGWRDLGNGFLSAAANNVLKANMNIALTAGIVRILAIGTEE